MGKMSLLLLVSLLLYLRLQTHHDECRYGYRPSMKMLLYRLDMCYAKRFMKMSILLMIVFEIISAVQDICAKLNECGCEYEGYENTQQLDEDLDEYEEELYV